MPTESLELSWTLPVVPAELYRSWLDSEAHGRLTGSVARVEPAVGGPFSAWDGYIQGTTLELEPDRRIVQSWRTSEFPQGSADSRLELLLEATDEGTRVTLLHTEIPEGQGESYRKGWGEFYVQPMTRYFRESSTVASPRTQAQAKQAPARKAGAKKKAAARTASVKKAPAKKAGAKKAGAKRAPAKRAPAKRAPAKKAAAKRAPAKKASAKKAAAKKSSAKRGGRSRKR